MLIKELEHRISVNNISLFATKTKTQPIKLKYGKLFKNDWFHRIAAPYPKKPKEFFFLEIQFHILSYFMTS